MNESTKCTLTFNGYLFNTLERSQLIRSLWKRVGFIIVCQCKICVIINFQFHKSFDWGASYFCHPLNAILSEMLNLIAKYRNIIISSLNQKSICHCSKDSRENDIIQF